jgi:hypothetical protein
MPFVSMNVILLHSDHRHVSATHVAIFGVVTAIIRIHLQYVQTTPQLKAIQTE